MIIAYLPKQLHRYFPYSAIALFPFIFLKSPEQKNNVVLINHERIHLKQQLELLILPFYILYLGNYFINLFRFRDHFKAYYHIVFEQEAYLNEQDLNYLRKRRLFSFRKYFR